MKKETTAKQLGSYLGVDLGDKKHYVCVTDKDGIILQEFSISNTRKALEDLASSYPQTALAMEVGTHSPWISRLLTDAGLKVTVANPRKLRAIYQNDRKCDELDARMLAKLLRVDPSLLSPVKHGSEQAQKDLLVIKMRDTLVRQRVHIITSIRGLLKSVGLRLPTCSTAFFHHKAEYLLADHGELSPAFKSGIAALKSITEQIEEYDQQIHEASRKNHSAAVLLQQIPSVGPITSLAFVLIIEDPQRFKDPRDVGAYLGLVPRRDQSGATDRQLPISKSGNSYLRKLLVQSAQYLLGHYGPDCALRTHGLKLAAKGGPGAKKKAIIAVARKLAVMMIVMWQRNSAYNPFPSQRTQDGEATLAPKVETSECGAQMAAR